MQTPISVSLNPMEMQHAELVAVQRVNRHHMLSLSDVDGLLVEERERLQLDINAAAAELAVAKLLHRDWNLTNEKGDNVDCIEVKSTTLKTGSLVITSQLIDRQALCVLVIGQAPRFRVVGCLDAVEGPMKGRLFSNPPRPNIWLVGQGELESIDLVVKRLAIRDLQSVIK